LGNNAGGDSNNNAAKYDFDASRCSSVYGNSDTVQPPAIRVSWCIQVFNAATALSKQQSAQLASQMQMKAQTDLANVDSNIDFIIKHEEAADGSWWYDLYRSGKVVQGGFLYVGTLGSGKTFEGTVTFPIECADTNYHASVSASSRLSRGGSTGNEINTQGFTETGMAVRMYNRNSSTNIVDTGLFWGVKGYAATE
jgi:hypothetical protein